MAVTTVNRKSNDIKLCTINICGLSDKSRFVLDKYAYDNKFDGLAVQETGNDDIEAISLNNMSTITDSNHSINRGTALYVNNQHTITKLEQISQNYKNIDSCWGLAVLNGTRFIIGNVYVKLADLNGISDVISMLAKADQISSQLKAKGVILVGDMNARHTSWGDTRSNEYGTKLFNDLDNTKFSIRTADTPSFLCENGSSYIDLVILSNDIVSLINKIETDTDIELFSGAPSRGHVPIIISFKSNNYQTTPIIEKLSLKSINWNYWSNDVEKEVEGANDIVNLKEDPKLLLEFLENILTDTIEKHGKKILISCHSKPYWNDQLSALSKQLRYDRKNFRLRNTDRNREKFLASKEEFDQERKRACQEFILDKTRNLNAVESQKFWKEFKKITTKKNQQKINPLDNGNGDILTENEEIEQLLFSTFFECKHMEEVSFNEEFHQQTNEQYENIMHHKENNEDQEETKELNSEISEEEIKKCLKEVKSSGKSFDNHNCQPAMLKNLGPQSLNLILFLFNLCFNMTMWIWDTAEVVFLKKAGKKVYSIPGSYRPISITAYLGKLLEKILSVRLNKFLKKKRTFDPYQEGFTEKKNTIRYLNRLLLDIKYDLHKGKTVICLFLDFEKAFDSVWKKGLIVKLFLLGIKGKFLSLIDQFLQTRKVYLNVNGWKGETRKCSDYGLPQGSVLSPILFKIFMLDFLEDLDGDKATLYKFADDGSVKISADTTEDCLKQLQNVLDSLDEWAKKWRMVINCQPNKTEVVCFGTAENDRTLVPTEFKLGDNKIKLVQQTKVLGITIDQDLSFLQHSQDMYKKLVTRWNLIKLYCNRNWGFNQKVLVELIRTLFVSCLMYGSHLWMNSQNMKEINSLYYKLLKTAVGPVYNIKRNVAEVILGLPPLATQNKINQIKHFLKIIMNNVPEDPLKDSIHYMISNNPPPDLKIALKAVYKFLNWKIQFKPGDFSDNDKQIINQNHLSSFHLLSPSCGQYSKTLITNYTELLWEDSIRNEFLLEGESVYPTPSCKPLPLNSRADRTHEVKVMSMFYEHNLLNSFLYRRSMVASPMCPCGEEEQTAFHFVTRCELVDAELRGKALECIQAKQAAGETTTALLNLSRNTPFINVLSDIINAHGHLIRSEVNL